MPRYACPKKSCPRVFHMTPGFHAGERARVPAPVMNAMQHYIPRTETEVLSKEWRARTKKTTLDQKKRVAALAKHFFTESRVRPLTLTGTLKTLELDMDSGSLGDANLVSLSGSNKPLMVKVVRAMRKWLEPLDPDTRVWFEKDPYGPMYSIVFGSNIDGHDTNHNKPRTAENICIILAKLALGVYPLV